VVVPSALFLAGESLARGYLGRPDLTAEQFIPLPHPPVVSPDNSSGRAAAVRVYRTGDRVRWTGSGELEFLGRLDGQVKIRGCRVEPAEIEAVLGQHAFVREGLVVIRPDERDQPQLIAYVLPAPGDAGAGKGRIHETDLMIFLRSRLPAFMVPAAVVFLAAWPLTPHGKIDRGALPAPAAGAAEPDGLAAPASGTEQSVARIWTEILGRGGIGREDNFFELGGHSLLAAQVVSRINHALQVALSVRTIFDQPTIAGLAQEVEARRQTGDTPRMPARRLRRRRATAELLQPN
jgi:hypothetical protein